MRDPVWDDRARLCGLAVLVLRDQIALGLRRLADRIEVPDPYPPTQKRRHGR